MKRCDTCGKLVTTTYSKIEKKKGKVKVTQEVEKCTDYLNGKKDK